MPCDNSAANVNATNTRELITRWEKLIASKNLQLFERLHIDMFNVPFVRLPVVSLQTRLTKNQPAFYMMSKAADYKDHFQIFGLPINGETRET